MIETHPDRESWLAARGIGGSDAPAIMGCGYDSEYELYHYKKGTMTKDFDNPLRLKVGLALEPLVSEEVGQDESFHGLVPFDPGDFTLLRDEDRLWRTGTPDRWMMGGKVEASPKAFQKHDAVLLKASVAPLSIKTVSAYVFRDDADHRFRWTDDEPSMYAAIQLQHELSLVDHWTHGYVVALVGLGDAMHVYRVERDQDMIDVIVDAEEKFHERLENDDPPPIDGSPGTAAALSKLYPRETLDSIQVPDDLQVRIPEGFVEVQELVQMWHQGRELKKNGEALERLAANHLKGLIADHDAVEIEGVGRFTWKEQVRRFKAREASESRSRVFRGPKPPKPEGGSE